MPDLTTLATIRQAVPRLASVSDAEVSRLITEASSVIESYCNRQFGQATFTETHNISGGARVFLRQRPIVSITSIVTGLPNGSVTLDPSRYTFDARTGEVRGVASNQWFPNDGGYPPDPFGWGFQAIQVVYVAGYGTVPGAVSGRCLAVVNRAAAGLANMPGMTSKTLGDLSYGFVDWSMFTTLTADDRRILAPFRVYSFR